MFSLIFSCINKEQYSNFRKSAKQLLESANNHHRKESSLISPMLEGDLMLIYLRCGLVYHINDLYKSFGSKDMSECLICVNVFASGLGTLPYFCCVLHGISVLTPINFWSFILYHLLIILDKCGFFKFFFQACVNPYINEAVNFLLFFQ